MPTTLVTPLQRFEQGRRSRAASLKAAAPSAAAAMPFVQVAVKTLQKGPGTLVLAFKGSSSGLTLAALAIATTTRAMVLPVLAMTFAPTEGLLVVLATVLDVVIAALAMVAWSLAKSERTALEELRTAVVERGEQHAPPSLMEDGPALVAGLAKAINTSQRVLAGRVTEQFDFQAALAHDLRTPLTRIGLRCERISEVYLRDAVERDLAEVNALVEDCLACCRSQRGVAESRRRVHLDSLLESLVCDYQDAGSTVALDGRVGRPVMTCPAALRRVLINLIDNALRYGDEVRLRVHADSDQLVLAILDSGPGIAPEELEAVFAPWYRAAGSSERTQGSGLGLAIARRLIQSMDGNLLLENRERGGLEARLTLPLVLT